MDYVGPFPKGVIPGCNTNNPENCTGLLKRNTFAHPFETCGFVNTKIKGHHHLQGNVQVYNVRMPGLIRGYVKSYGHKAKLRSGNHVDPLALANVGKPAKVKSFKRSGLLGPLCLAKQALQNLELPVFNSPTTSGQDGCNKHG